MARQSRVLSYRPKGTSPVLPKAQGLPWARVTALVLLLAPHNCRHFAASTEPHTLGCPSNACPEPAWPRWAAHYLLTGSPMAAPSTAGYAWAGWRRMLPHGAGATWWPGARRQHSPPTWISTSASFLIAFIATIPWASATPQSHHCAGPATSPMYVAPQRCPSSHRLALGPRPLSGRWQGRWKSHTVPWLFHICWKHALPSPFPHYVITGNYFGFPLFPVSWVEGCSRVSLADLPSPSPL